jgi:hypothetical protein
VLGLYRDRGRWFDRFESEKRGHAPGADAGEGAKHVLEVTSVNGGNVEQDVVDSGDGVGAQQIRQAVQCPCELGVTRFGMFSEGDEDEGFDAQFDLLVINDEGREAYGQGDRADRERGRAGLARRPSGFVRVAPGRVCPPRPDRVDLTVGLRSASERSPDTHRRRRT